ncbi:hypothetical protein [Streptomyces phaeoluteigriseus]|uniref:hypothetical protein n=1 Tax=Streptomyces phaeoluteigriseus TaxID=114686 RepID=UPI00367EAACD
MFREQFRAQAVGREPVPPLVPLLPEVPASACIAPIRPNTPAAPAGVTAAVRRAHLRTAAAPRALLVMTVPLL